MHTYTHPFIQAYLKSHSWLWTLRGWNSKYFSDAAGIQNISPMRQEFKIFLRRGRNSKYSILQDQTLSVSTLHTGGGDPLSHSPATCVLGQGVWVIPKDCVRPERFPDQRAQDGIFVNDMERGWASTQYYSLGCTGQKNNIPPSQTQTLNVIITFSAARSILWSGFAVSSNVVSSPQLSSVYQESNTKTRRVSF